MLRYNIYKIAELVIITNSRGDNMKICIRAHDLGVKGTLPILERLQAFGIDGVQMVCYKAYDDIPYRAGGITSEKAEQIGRAFREAGKTVPLVGAYFNPVHSNPEKLERGIQVFEDYLRLSRELGSGVVGSETGSFHDDEWIYHPRNRTEEALQSVVGVFSRLCDFAQDYGASVAMEGAAGHVCYDVATLARARKMMGRPTKVIFDLYNYLDESNQGDYLSILDRGLDTFAGEILLFHLKDCQFVNGQRPTQVPFGTGEMDLPQVLGKIKAYDRDAVLMLEGTTGDAIAAAVTTIKTIWERV